MKDLRELKKEEFKQVYEYVKSKTDNFTHLDKSLLEENPQYLLVVRFTLGLSQLEFSKLLGTTNKQWVRHFEAGRQGFKQSKMYEKAFDLINKLYSEDKVIDYRNTLLCWKRSYAARSKSFLKPRKEKYIIKKFNRTTIDNFKVYFNYLKKETKNFTHFNKDILYTTPEFIVVFRIILDLSHRSLAKILKIMPRTVRLNETRQYKMTPEKCEFYTKNFRRLFKKNKMIGNVNINNAIKNFKRISRYDEFEEEVIQELKSNKIKLYYDQYKDLNSNYAKIHVDLMLNKTKRNFDFLIFKNNKPIIVIEATKLMGTNTQDRIRIRARYRISYLDHRFQMLKQHYPKIITFTTIKCQKDREDLIKRFLKMEVMNTDFYFVNDVKGMVKRVKQIVY